MTEKTKIRYRYSEMKKKPEFYRPTESKETLTDQSQICSASIVEMAKKFGIDAIIAKAEKMEIDDRLKDKLYGHDYTKMFKSREELLNTKKRLNNLFENVPARIRKEIFNDSVEEFINAYTYNDETKLTQLNRLGLVSDTQLDNVKKYNQKIEKERIETETRAKFTEELKKQGETLYETFKKTGIINTNDIKNNTANNSNIQSDI